ncbi:MAG: hypothetical protein ACK55Z_06020 [bacterium]
MFLQMQREGFGPARVVCRPQGRPSRCGERQLRERLRTEAQP